jgi:hypothetical protein
MRFRSPPAVPSTRASTLVASVPAVLALTAGSLSLAVAGCPRTGGGTGVRDSAVPTTDMSTAMDLPSCTSAGTEDTTALCNDGCDNNGNGYADCDDRGCCDVRRDCPTDTFCGRPRRDASMVMTCAVMADENTTATCTNGCDDDADGYVDCDDFNCCRVRRDCPTDSFCGQPRRDGGTGTNRCDAAAMPENTVAACSDGCSNDDDGFVDCMDFDCAGIHPCPGDGGFITCSAEVVPENTPERCSDGCSNDGDRFVDCMDFDCAGIGSCPARMDGGGSTGSCDGGGTPENTRAACANGVDDDCDGFTDCNDFDCCGLVTCGAGTSCASRDAGVVMLCPGPEVPENTPERCSDRCSNDGDRFVDCDDRDCCTVRTDCPSGTFCRDRFDAGP